MPLCLLVQGVYPGDNHRLKTDWTDVYRQSTTPTIAKLPWYTTFGNHDIVINGKQEVVSEKHGMLQVKATPIQQVPCTACKVRPPP